MRRRVRLVLPSVLTIGVPCLRRVRPPADHTPEPATVTVPGSFQDELGCLGDWQPECALAHLTSGADGVWRATLALAAGSWEYKAALNDNWDESYGAGGVENGAPAIRRRP